MSPSRRLSLDGLLAAYLSAYGWATHRLYDELAWAYDPVSAFVSAGRWDHWRRLALDSVAGPRVLELGFGTGELLLEMAGRGLDVCGLEVSAAMQRVTARKVAQRRHPVSRLRGRTQALPFVDATFDTVIATFPAGYILEAATLQEVCRVLRPAGGRLVVAALSVELPLSWRFPLSWVPSSWDRLYAVFEQRAVAAGLMPAVTWHNDPPARVPLIVATRKPDERRAQP